MTVENGCVKHDYFNIVCLKCGHRHRVAVKCGNRYCSECNSFRMRETVQVMLNCFDRAVLPPQHRWQLMTLTMQSEGDLLQMADRFKASWRRFIRATYLRRRIGGGFWRMEVKRSVKCPGKWHVHMHVVCYSHYLDFGVLGRLWIWATNGAGVVWQHGGNTRSGVDCRRVTGNLSSVARYLSTYLAKNDLSYEDQLYVSKVLSGEMGIRRFGGLAKISVARGPKAAECRVCHETGLLPDFIAWKFYKEDCLYYLRRWMTEDEIEGRQFSGP